MYLFIKLLMDFMMITLISLQPRVSEQWNDFVQGAAHMRFDIQVTFILS